MNSADIIKSVFETALVLFTIWALFHEDKFAAFEERLFCKIRRRKLKETSVAKSDAGKIVRFN